MTRSKFLIIRDTVISLCIIILSFIGKNVIWLINGGLFLIFNVYDYTSKDGIYLYEIKTIKNEKYIVNGMIIKFVNLVLSLLLIKIGIYKSRLIITIIGCIILIITAIDIRFKIPLFKLKRELHQ